MARLIDSSVLITMERRRLPASALRPILGKEDVALAAVTVSELLVGIYRADTPERRQAREIRLDALLEAFPVVAFDLRVARTYGRVLAELMASGQAIEAHDGMIAATALTHGYGILTENARHFTPVPGLNVLTPTWP